MVSNLYEGGIVIVFRLDDSPLHPSPFMFFSGLPTLKITLRLSALEFSMHTNMIIPSSLELTHPTSCFYPIIASMSLVLS